jgi:peptidoglycan/LPS O-acetylase OafA/YrhL
MYRPDIDGLRAFAVLFVIGFHFFPNIVTGGFIGVDVFFVISGYLICGILLKDIDRGEFSILRFYSRRIRRIFPALITVLLAVAIGGHFLLFEDEFAALGKHILGGSTFISNFILWQESGYFDLASTSKPLLHLWSLGIEEQFYIFFPLFLFILNRLKIPVTLSLILCAALSFGVNIYLVRTAPTADFYSPLSRVWELLLGATLRSLERRNGSGFADVWISANPKTPASLPLVSQTSTPGWIKVRRINNTLCCTGICLIILPVFIFSGTTPWPGISASLPVFGTLMMIASGKSACLNRCVLSNRLAVWIGLISYPLYLWHWPILSFTNSLHDNKFDTIPTNIKFYIIAGSFALSIITFFLIERPIRFNKSLRKTKIACCLAMMALLGVFGLLVYNNFIISKPLVGNRILRAHYYIGKDSWIFLGNNYNDIIRKLRLDFNPGEYDINRIYEPLKRLVHVAQGRGMKCILFIPPNKSSVYKEYLPEYIVPSNDVRYLDFFKEKFKNIPGLFVYDPLNVLLAHKNVSYKIYYMMDTHWNAIGAYVAFNDLCKQLGFPEIPVSFEPGPPRKDDLVDRIANPKDHPKGFNDNFRAILPVPKSDFNKVEIQNPDPKIFNEVAAFHNDKALTSHSVMVIGDSYYWALEEYIPIVFRDVTYIGHWEKMLWKDLADHLEDGSLQAPEYLLIEIIERAF